MLPFKLALRTLRRFRLYTLINATSLVLSFVCIFSLSRYIYRECTIDSELPDHERVFFTIGDKLALEAGVPPRDIVQFNAVDFTNDKSPETNILNTNEKIIERSTLSASEESDEIQLKEGQPRLAPLKVLYADSAFFDLIQFKALHGTLKVKGENDALIMSDVAQKIFGTTNVIGMKWTTLDHKLKTIVGVIQRPRCKTTFDFDLVYNINQSDRYISKRSLVKLYQAEDSTLINDLLAETFDKEMENFKGTGYSFMMRMHLLSHENFIKNMMNDSQQLRLYIIMMLIFLLIGSFNYLNLHSVIMHRRKRDFQVKTIFGANKKKIFSELFMEHLIILTAILPFIWLFVYLARNPLNEIFNIPLESDIRFDIALTLAIPLVLGVCFALFSYFQIHRQTLDTSGTSVVPAARRSSYARIAFLFVQYVMTFCLIVFALYLNHHVYYIFHNDRGYRSKNVLYFNINSSSSSSEDNALTYGMQNQNRATRKQDIAREFERNILASSLFTGVTFGERPYDLYDDNQFVTEDGKVIQAASHHATKEWMEFFQLPFRHGRNWTEQEQSQIAGGINDDAPLTTDNTFKVIVNETLWNLLSPQQQQETFYMDKKGNLGPTNQNINVKIVGVIKDFSLWKLTNKVDPLIFYLENKKGYYSKLVFAAVKPGKEEEATRYLKDLHQKLCPEGTFECKWLDEDLQERHKDDFKAVKSISVFAIIAILISCLGLFGISLYDIRGRYREIALRKVNGAHNKDIYRILLRKYTLTMLGTALVASPFAYWGVTEYMSEVGNRAPLTIWIFLGALLLLALVSLLTLMAQVRRAVHISPAEVMKTE